MLVLNITISIFKKFSNTKNLKYKCKKINRYLGLKVHYHAAKKNQKTMQKPLWQTNVGVFL
jgi:hypothetical protein